MSRRMDSSQLRKINETNRRKMHIAYSTIGNPGDPCVIIPPGGGATKENSLFWARELATIGNFFVVLYDLRDTGGSEKTTWENVFAPFKTTAEEEVLRLTGREAGLSAVSKEKKIEPMNDKLMEQLWDYDAYARDAITVMDELNISKAHVMGLSQGGMLSQLIAMQYPDRVLTCVSAGTVFDASGTELAMLSTGAEEFYNKVKAANLFDEKGKTYWKHESVSKKEYVTWKVAMLQIIVPGFPLDVYSEIAEKEFDAGIVTPEQNYICCLSWELWTRTGKLDRHHKQLRANNVPILFVHGRKDPIIHFEEVRRLFKITKNCILETHDFGHNFGPPAAQEKLLAKIATFMRRYAKSRTTVGLTKSEAVTVGGDAYDADVTIDANSMKELNIKQLYDTFCSVQTAADTHAVFAELLQRLQLEELSGRGLQLFLALRTELSKVGLNFKQLKLIRDIYASLLKTQKVVAHVKYGGKKQTEKMLQESTDLYDAKDPNRFNKVVVCGAGPVGLRAACELQLMGFDVVVVEKRPNFSRANILTFWDETMADMLGLGAKSYFPDLQPAGMNKHLGTRQIQVSLLKTLLLLGGRAEYGMEVCGVCPPAFPTDTSDNLQTSWGAYLRPYVKHGRSKETKAELALEFQETKDYVEGKRNEQEHNVVDEEFCNAKIGRGEYVRKIDFDAYIIAEGGWSNSTKKLGFSKAVQNFKSVFGLVINAKYNPGDMKEKNMRSQIHFALSGNWPLQRCPIQAEFLEYLKGETHFLALVVPKKNVTVDQTDKYLERMEKEALEKGVEVAVPQSVIKMMRLASTQKGLLEMGVFKKDLGTGRECLVPENVDVEQLHATARAIMSELGLPDNVPFCDSNPVQLFDFSRRARCMDPVRILHTSSSATSVLSQAEFEALTPDKGHHKMALALPVGDALQEPNWTKGLGINRGFHTAMNQAFVCLLAREKSIQAAVTESRAVHDCMVKMKWGMTNSSLAGSGSGDIGLKPFKEWDADPRNRIPYK